MRSSETEYTRLLRQLTEIHSRIESLLEERSGRATDGISPDAVRAALSNSRFRIRRQRFFGKTLFGDPAWEILTELYLAAVEESPQPVADLALTSAVPRSTALRWIEALVVEGWILKYPDDSDPQRLLVRLSEKGRRSMNLVFSEPKILTLGR